MMGVVCGFLSHHTNPGLLLFVVSLLEQTLACTTCCKNTCWKTSILGKTRYIIHPSIIRPSFPTSLPPFHSPPVPSTLHPSFPPIPCLYSCPCSPCSGPNLSSLPSFRSFVPPLFCPSVSPSASPSVHFHPFTHSLTRARTHALAHSRTHAPLVTLRLHCQCPGTVLVLCFGFFNF